MKALPQFLILLSLSLQAQITAVIPNLRLTEQEVLVELNSTQDTLFIQAKEGLISKVSVIQRVAGDRSIRTAPLTEYRKNEYRIPLHVYRIGAYTVEVHYKPHIYPFKMFRVKHIPYDMSLDPNIKSYRAEYGVVSGFSSYTGEIKALTKKRMDELILKFEVDQYTKTGNKNWLKVFAVYEDRSEKIYYTID
jgi:hypothetical protein